MGLCPEGATPGVETPTTPDEVDAVDADYALQGVEIATWRRVRRVRRVVCGFSKGNKRTPRFLGILAAVYNLCIWGDSWYLRIIIEI